MSQRMGAVSGDFRGFSGNALKVIAMTSMLIDHAAVALIERGAWAAGNVTTANTVIYYIMRAIGRLAFPMFCFLIAEGYVNTRNAQRYLIRLVTFGLISEVPFDIAFYGKTVDTDAQNVFFTLASGLVAIMLWDRMLLGTTRDMMESEMVADGSDASESEADDESGSASESKSDDTTGSASDREKLKSLSPVMMFVRAPRRQKLRVMLMVAAIGLTMTLLDTDYGGIGTLVIVCMYIFRGQETNRNCMTGIALMGSGIAEVFGMLAFVPLHFYNGERGMARVNKYVFYVFYPLHIGLLIVVRYLMYGAWL